MKKGYEFESETDTEVIVKLIQHIANKCEGASFRQLVEATIQHLVSNSNISITENFLIAYCQSLVYILISVVRLQ